MFPLTLRLPLDHHLILHFHSTVARTPGYLPCPPPPPRRFFDGADAHGMTGDINIPATIIRQKFALKEEIARTAEEELQIQYELSVQTQQTTSEHGRTGEVGEGGVALHEPVETKSGRKMVPRTSDSPSAAGIGQKADDPG